MNDTKDLIREIQEHTAAHGGENTATHLLVQAVMALQRQADEMAAIGAGGVSGPLLGGAAPKAPELAAPALAALFREALAWGMTYGPAIPAHQWDDMRESMVAQYVGRAALAAPQQAAPAAEWLEQAYREGWAACRDAETIGQEAEDWAFGNSTANSRMIDMQQAAPQQEVQEPVWDGKLSDAMQNALDALSLECGPVIAKDIAHQVREECEAIYTSYTTTKRMYHAARDKLEAIESAQPQPDPFATHQQEVQEPTNEMYRAAQKIVLPYDDDGGTIILNTSQIRAIWQAMIAAAPKAPQQAAPAVPIERVKFTDQSTASPIEKARRYLQAMADHRINSVYQFDDGYPRQTTADDAAATLAVFDQLATQPAAAPKQEVQEPWGYARRMKSSGWGLCCKREYAEAATDGDDAVKLYTAQPAPSGDAEDAARYRVIRNSIDLDEILKTVKDPGKWETPYAVLMRGAELDEAVDAARKGGK